MVAAFAAHRSDGTIRRSPELQGKRYAAKLRNPGTILRRTILVSERFAHNAHANQRFTRVLEENAALKNQRNSRSGK